MKEDSSSKHRASGSGEEVDSVELGKFYFLNGKYKEAIGCFNRALDINKNNYEALYHLGLIYENQNQKDTAVKMFERAASINPEYKIAIAHMNRLKGLK